MTGNPNETLALDTGSFGTRLENVAATWSSSFASLLDASPLNVGMVVVVGWRGTGRASKMVILGFAFPLDTSVGLWTSRTAITGSEATEKKERVLSISGGTFNCRVLLIQRMI